MWSRSSASRSRVAEGQLARKQNQAPLSFQPQIERDAGVRRETAGSRSQRRQRGAAKQNQGCGEASCQGNLKQQAAQPKSGKQRERHQAHGLSAVPTKVGNNAGKQRLGQIETQRERDDCGRTATRGRGAASSSAHTPVSATPTGMILERP